MEIAKVACVRSLCFTGMGADEVRSSPVEPDAFQLV